MSARPVGRWLLIGFGVAIAASVAAAIVAMGTPGTQRDTRLDARRVADLNALDQVVRHYAKQHDRLPANLDVALRPEIKRRFVDPVSGIRYGYRIVDARHFRLCAHFATVDDSVGYGDLAIDWAHGTGEQCFDRSLGTDKD